MTTNVTDQFGTAICPDTLGKYGGYKGFALFSLLNNFSSLVMMSSKGILAMMNVKHILVFEY